ncbi:neuronal acetylcholine receptor subunit beta-4-like [Glandiceps talaboti]
MLILACIMVIVLQLTGSDASPAERNLQELLFTNHSKHVRPVPNFSDIMKIRLGFTLNMIMDVEWYDYQLQWNPADHDGIEEVIVPEDWVWRPNVAVANSGTDDYFIPTSGLVIIFYNGTAKANALALFTFPCNMNIRHFPFDTQTCSMTLAPWLYDDNFMQTEALPDSVVNGDLDNTEWSIESGTAEISTLYSYNPLQGWSVITFTITFKRRPLYYIMNILLPCMLMAVLTLLVYLLPCDCGEKMSFSVSVLITMSVFNLLVGDIMPPSSDSVPLIVRYLLFNMTLVSFSILIATFVLRLHHRTRRHLRMAPWIKRVFIDVLPSLLMMEKCKEMKVADDKMALQPFFIPSNNGKPADKTMDIEYEEMDVMKLNKQNINLGVQTLKTDVFHEILQEIKNLKFKTEVNEIEEEMLEDWKYVAAVVDRLLLWISLIVYVISTVALFLLEADIEY